MRQLGEIALDGVDAVLLERMKEAMDRQGGAVTLNTLPPPQRVKGEDHVRMTNWKNAEAEAPASADREDIVRQSKKPLCNLRVVSDNRRCLDTASRRRSKPHAPVVSRHLRLVWSAGHASPPTIARTSSAAMTSRKPAKK